MIGLIEQALLQILVSGGFSTGAVLFVLFIFYLRNNRADEKEQHVLQTQQTALNLSMVELMGSTNQQIELLRKSHERQYEEGAAVRTKLAESLLELSRSNQETNIRIAAALEHQASSIQETGETMQSAVIAIQNIQADNTRVANVTQEQVGHLIRKIDELVKAVNALVAIQRPEAGEQRAIVDEMKATVAGMKEFFIDVQAKFSERTEVNESKPEQDSNGGAGGADGGGSAGAGTSPGGDSAAAG